MGIGHFSRVYRHLAVKSKNKINYDTNSTLQNHYLNEFKSKKVITKLKDFGKDTSKNDEEADVVEHHVEAHYGST